eukprot:15176525-Heterocapsa_arctica.AAC.1
MSLRTNLFEALWPNKYMCCKATGLMLADKGELEPKLAIIKRCLSIGLGKLKEAFPRKHTKDGMSM